MKLYLFGIGPPSLYSLYSLYLVFLNPSVDCMYELPMNF